MVQCAVDESFELLHSLKRDDWKNIKSAEDRFHVAVLDQSWRKLLMRNQVEVDHPVAFWHKFLQPEVVLNDAWCKLWFGDVESSCVEFIAPGDAIVRLQFRDCPRVLPLQFLVSLAKPFPHDGSVTVSFRMTSRANFPESGQLAIALSPQQGGCELPCQRVLVVEESTNNPGKTLMTRVMSVANMPVWAQSFVLPKIGLAWVDFLEVVLSHHLDISNAIDTIVPTHTVISLRKCSRGKPLLPRWSNDASTGLLSEWEPVASHISLTNYLREFLKRLGIQDVIIFDSIGGQPLVPYQACVLSCDWKHAWAYMEEPFRKQRSAYRKLLGGSSAPTLDFGSTPRFTVSDMQPNTSDVRSSSVKPASVVDAECIAVPVRCTFVHFSPQPFAPRNAALTRSYSDPHLRPPLV